MKWPAYALFAALLAVPLVWVLPVSEQLGPALCLGYSLPLALSLFAYYLAWGGAIHWLRTRRGGPPIFLGLLLYVNLPLTAVHLYRATEWSRAFTCG